MKHPPIEPYLTVKGGDKAITFYKHAFGAEEAFKMMADDGKRVLHATLNLLADRSCCLTSSWKPIVRTCSPPEPRWREPHHPHQSVEGE